MRRKLVICIVGLGVLAATLVAATYTSMQYINLTNSIINSTAIGATTPSTAAFTTASASGGFTGNLTGTASNVPWSGVISPPYPVTSSQNWVYSGQSGQPSWLWGTNDGANMRVWNPANFSVLNSTELNGATVGANIYTLGTNGSGQLVSSPRTISINYVIDGGGATITTGAKGWLLIPTNCTITTWFVAADQAGSINITVYTAPYTNLSSITTISGSNPPFLSSQQQNASGTTGWSSNSLTANSYVGFTVNSATTVTRVTVVLTATIP